MAFCDATLGDPLTHATAKALNAGDAAQGPKEELEAAVALARLGLAEGSWKGVSLSASWSFWKDLTKPHNKVRPITHLALSLFVVSTAQINSQRR